MKCVFSLAFLREIKQPEGENTGGVPESGLQKTGFYGTIALIWEIMYIIDHHREGCESEL